MYIAALKRPLILNVGFDIKNLKQILCLLAVFSANLSLMNTQVSPSTYTLITHQITTEDGLPSNEIYQVFQDHYGYIWFATDVGWRIQKPNNHFIFRLGAGLPESIYFGLGFSF